MALDLQRLFREQRQLPICASDAPAGFASEVDRICREIRSVEVAYLVRVREVFDDGGTREALRMGCKLSAARHSADEGAVIEELLQRLPAPLRDEGVWVLSEDAQRACERRGLRLFTRR